MNKLKCIVCSQTIKPFLTKNKRDEDLPTIHVCWCAICNISYDYDEHMIYVYKSTFHGNDKMYYAEYDLSLRIYQFINPCRGDNYISEEDGKEYYLSDMNVLVEERKDMTPDEAVKYVRKFFEKPDMYIALS